MTLRSFLLVSLFGLSLTACGGQEAGTGPKTLKALNSGSSGQIEAAYVWWEAENPSSTDFPESHFFEPEDAEQAAMLSEGEWIGIDAPFEGTRFLEYEVQVPETGEYYLFARKFWKHGPFRWRFEGDDWAQVTSDVALLDGMTLRLHTVANWVSLGTVELEAGTRTLRIETTQNDSPVVIDCFLLIDAPYVPKGTLKPGEKAGGAPEGWFAFEPDPDPHAPSPIDLSYLNEEFAGRNGHIRVADGRFIHGDSGEEVRFWAFNTGMDGPRMDPALIDMYARFLAKKGVNMVRVHGGVWGPDYRIDPQLRDQLFYYIAAMKEEGIYTTLSIFFPLWMSLDENGPFEGYSGGQHPFALPFFSEEFMGYYRSWWRDLLTVENPYTGMTLAEDPAVAVAEMINEDSYFFWTFTPYQNIPAAQMAILERAFGEWLSQEYGSVQSAFDAWGGDAVRGDDATAGRAGFVELWQMASRGTQRDRDTARFLTEHQADWFRDVYAYLKEDLGFQGLVYGSNWITADARVLGPLDKYSNTVADFMDRHGYYGGRHEGPRASYSLNPEEVYADRAGVRFDPPDPTESQEKVFANPIQDIIYNNLPSTISEVNWPMPNRFRADFPLLAAAYGSLQGSDGFFFFAHLGPTWARDLDKFPIGTPVTFGQFPATALMYRTGMVQTGEPVVEANLDMDSLFRLEGAPTVAPQNLDALREADIPAGQAGAKGAIDPLAFFVGPVKTNFVDSPMPSRIADLSDLIDRQGERVRSITGELDWDYGLGLVTVDTPMAQGATGFLSEAGSVDLPQVVIESQNEYGTVLLVALDGRPLAESERILLLVMTEDMNRGWQTSGDTLKTILDTGTYPVVVRNIAGTVRLTRSDAASMRVTALDHNGYPVAEVGTAQSIALAPDVLYYVIEK